MECHFQRLGRLNHMDRPQMLFLLSEDMESDGLPSGLGDIKEFSPGKIVLSLGTRRGSAAAFNFEDEQLAVLLRWHLSRYGGRPVGESTAP